MAKEKKKQLESTFLNMFIILTLFSLVSSFALAFTFKKTKDGIAKANKRKLEQAIKKVLPKFDKLGKRYKVKGFPRAEFYPATKNGKLVGTAVKSVSDKGFSGDVWIMVGLDTTGKIYNTAVLQHTETPGLGTNMSSHKFKDQFNGKDPAKFKLKVKKDGGNVDAITAATFSSRAFCDAVQRAYSAWKKHGGEK
jgi:electron transport complex protein RnfG